jgi:hypothetical protein
MKLSYRGASYEYNLPVLEVTEGEILGKYRGVDWRCHTVQEMPVPQPSHAFKYRGVPYGNQAGNAVPTTTAQVPTIQIASSIEIPDTLPAKEIARVHHANLRRNLERRLQAAQQRGDLNLVRMLEAESRELAL